MTQAQQQLIHVSLGNMLGVNRIKAMFTLGTACAKRMLKNAKRKDD